MRKARGRIRRRSAPFIHPPRALFQIVCTLPLRDAFILAPQRTRQIIASQFAVWDVGAPLTGQRVPPVPCWYRYTLPSAFRMVCSRLRLSLLLDELARI